MTGILRIVRHYDCDNVACHSDYTLITHPYRPADDAPYVPQGELPHRLHSLRSIRLVDPGAYYKGATSCYVPFDAVFDRSGDENTCRLAFGDGRWPAFSLAEPAARRLARMTAADLFNVFLSPTAAYYAALHYGVPQSLNDAFSYFSALECHAVDDGQPFRAERITADA